QSGMRIELCQWEECPADDLVLLRLPDVRAERQVAESVRLIEVTTEQQAEALRFPGSPTIRIDGQDLFPTPDGPYGLTCRVYRTDDGRVTPLPTTEMMRKAINGLLRGESFVQSYRTQIQ